MSRRNERTFDLAGVKADAEVVDRCCVMLNLMFCDRPDEVTLDPAELNAVEHVIETMRERIHEIIEAAEQTGNDGERGDASRGREEN